MKTLFSIILSGIAILVHGQNILNYQFSAIAGIYTPLIGGTTMPLSGGNTDDGWFNYVPIGFTFYYMGNPATTISASTKGWITFNQTISNAAYSNLLATGGTRPLLAPLWDDLNLVAAANFSFLTSGSAPERVFTAQWSNIEWKNSATAPGISFQVKLYEGSGKIEFIYHPESGSLSSPSASIGITAVGTGAGNFLSLSDASASPSVSSSTEITTIATKPADGQIYAFSPPSSSPVSPGSLGFTDITKTSMTVSWTDLSTTETWFDFYYSQDGINYLLLERISSTSTATTGTVYTRSHTGLLPGLTYHYRIIAWNEGHAPSPALSGSQATLAPAEITSIKDGNWSAASTWSGGTVPISLDNVTISDGDSVVIDLAAECNALTVGQGTTTLLRFGSTAQSLNVIQGVTVAANGVFAAGLTGGASLSHNLRIGGTTATATGTGSLTVHGTFDMYIGSSNGKVTVTFFGNQDASISGTGTIDFYRVILNKGNVTATATTIPPVLELLVPCLGSGVAEAGFLYTHTAGMVKIGGIGSFSSKVFSNASYTTTDLGGLWVSNPNFTLIGQAGNQTYNGLFRLSSGICNFGTAVNNALNTAAGATILIENGILNLAGRFSTGNAVNYIQQGGTVNVSTVGNSTSNTAGFGLTNTASSFTMSGGVLCLVKPNSNTTPASRLDYFNNAGTVSITGGELKLGNSSSGATRLFIIKGNTPSLEMTSDGGNSSANLSANLKVYGNLDLYGTGTFSNNTWSMTMTGNSSAPGNITVNTGATFTMNSGPSPALIFNSSTGNQIFTNNGTLTDNQLIVLTIDNTFGGNGTVTFPSGLIVKGDGTLNLINGTLQTGTSITLGTGGTSGFTIVRSNGQISGPVTHNHGSGVVDVVYDGTSAQYTGNELPGAISGTLTFENPGGITLQSAVATNKLDMISGNITTSSANLLTISGTGTADLVYTSGQINGPMARTLPAGLLSGSTYLFPLGKSAYRPVELINPVTSAGGTVKVVAEVFDVNAGGTPGSTMVSLNADRYWSLQISEGSANFTSSSVRFTESGLNINNGIAKSATKTGIYELASTNGPTGNTLTSNPLNSFSYFVIGNKKMNYVSSTATQTNTNYIREGSIDQVIIGIQVVTTGNLEPAQLTSLTFSTNGSSRPADIAAAKVYYTGTSASFANTGLFGTAFNNPAGTYTINGSQTLAEGVNYFWLAYDIVVGVIDNDLLDAECQSLTVRGVAYTPTITAPAGSRTVREALNGTVTVGTSGAYPTLTGAGGLFEKAGLVGLKSNVTAMIVSDIAEPGTNPLSQWIEVGGSGFRLTIRPQTPVMKTLSGSYAGGLIRLSKVSRVTLDGRFNSAGKYLSIANTATTGTIAALQLIGTAVGQGCTFITIRNCGFSTGYNGNNTFALCAGGATPGNAGYDHDSVNVTQCVVSRAQNGLYFPAQSTGSYNNLVIQEDSIGSLITGNEITKMGIFTLNCPGILINGNKIFNILSTGSEARGIYLGSGSINSTISANHINGVRYNGTGTYGVSGIMVTPGFTTVNVSVINNIVTDITGPGSSNLASLGVSGIRIENGTGFNIHYNSVNLFGNLNHAVSGDNSAALYINAQGSVTLTNNILKNSLVNTAASAWAYAIYSDMARTGFTQIDYNDYFGTGTQGRLGYCNYSVATTISAWRVTTLQDANSTGDDPVFASNTNLRIDLSSPARKHGTPVSGVLTDFENVTRNVQNPSMGALETTGDYRGPFISYSALQNTALLTARTLTATLTDSTGVPTSGVGLPVVYWKINNGTWNNTTGVHLGGNQFNFTFGNGVTTADSVFYYVAAQDVQSPPNVSASPSSGASGGSYNPPAFAIPPAPASFYKILQGLSGIITVGTGGDYPNLTGSSGLFNMINQNLLTGNLSATIISDIMEPGTISLNRWNEEGTGNYNLNIVPDGTTLRSLTGNVASALIILDGARRVIINGGTGDTLTKYLLFRNENTTGSLIRLINGAQNNTIRNCWLEPAYIGVQFGTSTVFNGNSWNTLMYNDIRKASGGIAVPLYCIYSNGSSSNPNKNNTIRSNNLYNFSSMGINITANGNGGEWIITGNSIFDNQSPAPVSIQRGIYFVAGSYSFGNIISNNYIGGQGPQCSGLPWNNEGVSNFYGIYFKAGWANNDITGNIIKNIHLSAGNAGSFYGITAQECQVTISGNVIGDPVRDLSIRSATANGSIDGIRVQYPSSTCLISDNRIYNLTFTSYSGYPDATGIYSDNAHIYNNLMYGIGYCMQPTLSPYITGIYLNSSTGSLNEIVNNSVSIDGGYAQDPSILGVYDFGSYEDFFLFYHNSVSITNVSPLPPPSLASKSPGIYYNETVALGRDSYAYFEMFNNVLINSRSSANPGNNYAFTYLDTTSHFSDFNDLFVTNDSLGIIDGIYMNDLTEWKAYSGRDLSSISQDPLFISASADLHLQANTPLWGAGTGIELVTEDLDGSPRNPVTPTIGCYEATYVPDKTWNGSISNDWGNGLNWTPSGVPGISDNLLIPSGTPYSCIIPTTGKLCNHLVIDESASLNVQVTGGITIFGNVTIKPTATLTNHGSMTLKKNLVNMN